MFYQRTQKLFPGLKVLEGTPEREGIVFAGNFGFPVRLLNASNPNVEELGQIELFFTKILENTSFLHW